AITPDETLHRGWHQFAMLAQQRAVGSEEQDGAVKSAAVALDDPDDKVKSTRSRRGADGLGRRTGYVDGTVVVATELLAPLVGPHPHASTKAEALGVSRDKRFGKDSQRGPAAGRIGGQVTQFLQGAADIENNRGGLYDGRPYRTKRHHLS